MVIPLSILSEIADEPVRQWPDQGPAIIAEVPTSILPSRFRHVFVTSVRPSCNGVSNTNQLGMKQGDKLMKPYPRHFVLGLGLLTGLAFAAPTLFEIKAGAPAGSCCTFMENGVEKEGHSEYREQTNVNGAPSHWACAPDLSFNPNNTPIDPVAVRAYWNKHKRWQMDRPTNLPIETIALGYCEVVSTLSERLSKEVRRAPGERTRTGQSVIRELASRAPISEANLEQYVKPEGTPAPPRERQLPGRGREPQIAETHEAFHARVSKTLRELAPNSAATTTMRILFDPEDPFWCAACNRSHPGGPNTPSSFFSKVLLPGLNRTQSKVDASSRGWNDDQKAESRMIQGIFVGSAQMWFANTPVRDEGQVLGSQDWTTLAFEACASGARTRLGGPTLSFLCAGLASYLSLSESALARPLVPVTPLTAGIRNLPAGKDR